jgi:hypothetical protein
LNLRVQANAEPVEWRLVDERRDRRRPAYDSPQNRQHCRDLGIATLRNYLAFLKHTYWPVKPRMKPEIRVLDSRLRTDSTTRWTLWPALK